MSYNKFFKKLSSITISFSLVIYLKKLYKMVFISSLLVRSILIIEIKKGT